MHGCKHEDCDLRAGYCSLVLESVLESVELLTCSLLVQVFAWVMCSDPERDSHRFMDIIASAAKEDKVQLYKRFKVWAEETSKRRRPKNPLKPKKKSKEESKGEQALIKAIRSASHAAWFRRWARSFRESVSENGSSLLNFLKQTVANMGALLQSLCRADRLSWPVKRLQRNARLSLKHVGREIFRQMRQALQFQAVS